MKHLKAGKRLGVTTSHRKALMRNLVTALLEHGEIRTTLTKAKEMRKYFDKMIGLGKKNNLHARRQALSFIKSKDVVKKLFEEYGPLYEDRHGGYTRIYRLDRRLGDNSQMALIQMVGLDESTEPVKEKAQETIEEVKEELQSEEEAQEATESVTAEEPSESAAVDSAEETAESEDGSQEAAAEESEPDSEEDSSEETQEEPATEESPETSEAEQDSEASEETEDTEEKDDKS